MENYSPTKCPKCGCLSDVRSSTVYKEAFKRWRVCKDCNYRWTTFEIHQDAYETTAIMESAIDRVISDLASTEL